MIFFNQRLNIEKMFLAWCKKNRVSKRPLSLVGYMQIKGWLNEERILKDLEPIKRLEEINATDKDVVTKHILDMENIRNFFHKRKSDYWELVMDKCLKDYEELLKANDKLSKIERIVNQHYKNDVDMQWDCAVVDMYRISRVLEGTDDDSIIEQK